MYVIVAFVTCLLI